MHKKKIDELVDFVMSKADKCYSDDFPINQIEFWIRDFFDQVQMERWTTDNPPKFIGYEWHKNPISK